MNVKDVMQTQFVRIQADDKFGSILKTFAKNHITSAPVFDKGEYIGVISISGVVSYFTPPGFLFLWRKKEPTPTKKLEKVIAANLVKKPKTVLRPEQMLHSVLKKIASEADCIPVIDKKGKMVGIVRDEDMLKFFLT